MKKILHILPGITVMFLVLISACRHHQPATASEPVKRTYAVFQNKPGDAIALKPTHDSTVVFYFDRSEWNKCVATLDSTGKAVRVYLNLLDSLEKINGTILFSQLKWTVSEKWQLNPGKTTQDIFDSLLIGGHVYILYPDGTSVKQVTTYSIEDFTGETVHFEDAANAHLLYYIAKKTRGQF